MTTRTILRQRKQEHLALCRTGDVEFQRRRTGLECVELVHQAVPVCPPDAVDLSLRFLGRNMAAPFLIGAMTGGTPEAGRVNRRLAEAAAAAGVGLALGSQRPMLEDPRLRKTFEVRRIAPDILLLGNLGLAQAATIAPAALQKLMDDVGADGINLHLNSAMELFQRHGRIPGGDAWRAIERHAKALGERLIVKETGCGISRETARRLAAAGVRTVDVAGAGGASWVRVENLRGGGAACGLEAFEEWGIPTAASLLEVKGLRLRRIASGGVRTGLDAAKCIALGADLASAALPALRALHAGGPSGLARWTDALLRGLRIAMVLTGCRRLSDLRRAPVVLTGPLREWADQRNLWRRHP